jgi:hypothetical protein
MSKERFLEFVNNLVHVKRSTNMDASHTWFFSPWSDCQVYSFARVNFLHCKFVERFSGLLSQTHRYSKMDIDSDSLQCLQVLQHLIPHVDI